MFEKFLNKLLHEDESKIGTESDSVKVEEAPKKIFSKSEIISVIFILFVGLIYRLAFIYGVSGLENAAVRWYGDTYHHWQIAYLTLTQGFDHGFLRLWDLKGMEFFWGPLNPLLTILIFKISGSFNVVILRYLSMFFGLGCLGIGYLLVKKYWGKAVAFSFLIFGALFPVAVFNDVTGSLEPIGVFLVLLAIYLSFKKPFLSGVVFAISTMVRAEAWLFSIGIIFALIIDKTYKRKMPLFLGWLVVMIIYMRYLWGYTGNAVYPLWWNYLANALGAWSGPATPLSPVQIAVKPILIAGAVISAGVLIYTLIKKPKGYALNIFGWGNIFFVTAFMGLTYYLTGWRWWFPVIRFFVWPYLFLSIVIFSFLGHEERKHPAWKSLLIFSVVTLTLVGQLTWIPIMTRFKETFGFWDQTVSWGKDVGQYYKGGTLLFPETDPDFTYTAVTYGKVPGSKFLSEMFDPYYYSVTDPKEINLWLKKYDVKLAVFKIDASRYQDLVKKEPSVFEYQATLDGGLFQIWKVFPDKIKQDGSI